MHSWIYSDCHREMKNGPERVERSPKYKQKSLYSRNAVLLIYDGCTHAVCEKYLEKIVCGNLRNRKYFFRTGTLTYIKFEK